MTCNDCGREIGDCYRYGCREVRGVAWAKPLVAEPALCTHTWESFDDGALVFCKRPRGHIGPHASTPDPTPASQEKP